MAMPVLKFLQLSGKHWNKIKNSKDIYLIEQFAEVFVRESCEYYDEISNRLIHDFASCILPQLEELRIEFKATIRISPVQAENEEPVETRIKTFKGKDFDIDFEDYSED